METALLAEGSSLQKCFWRTVSDKLGVILCLKDQATVSSVCMPVSTQQHLTVNISSVGSYALLMSYVLCTTSYNLHRPDLLLGHYCDITVACCLCCCGHKISALFAMQLLSAPSLLMFSYATLTVRHRTFTVCTLVQGLLLQCNMHPAWQFCYCACMARASLNNEQQLIYC